MFNAEVADRVETAAKKIQKLAPTDEKQKTVEEALEELKEGASIDNIYPYPGLRTAGFQRDFVLVNTFPL